MKKQLLKIFKQLLQYLFFVLLIVNVQFVFGQQTINKNRVFKTTINNKSVKEIKNFDNSVVVKTKKEEINNKKKRNKKNKRTSKKFLKSNVREISFAKGSKAVISSDGFETSVPPIGWIEYQETGTNSWAQTTARVNSGTYSCFFDDFNGDNSVWLISDPIDLDSYSSEIFSYYENINYGSYADYHYVLYSDDYVGSGDPNNATWYIVNDVVGTEDTWVQKQYDISALTGNSVYFAFLYIGNFASEWYIDDYQITGDAATACTTPTNQPTSLNLTPSYTSVDGTFTAATSSPDGYLVVVSTNSTLSSNPVDGTTYNVGNSLGGGTVVQSGAGTSFTASGLSDGTQYYFFIFSQNYSCTGGPLYLTTSPLTGNATTLSCTIATFPYSEDFDGVATPGLPGCWVIEDNSAPNDDWITTSTNPNSSPNCMYIEYDGSNALDDWAFTPPLTLIGGVTYKVRFKYRARSSSWTENLEVDWGTSNSSAAMSGTVIFDDNGFSNNTYVEGTGVFTPGSNGTYYVGWHAYSDANKFGIYVDDIEIFIPNDQTSLVDAPTSGQISAGDISSLKTTSADAVDVFRFDVTDLASGDALPTQVTTFNIHKNGGSADWTDHIAGAELWNGGAKISNLDVTITDTDITFTKSTGTFDVADGTSEEVTLKIWLNTSNIVDNSDMIFEVLQTGHGFVAIPAGSEFNSDFGVATVSNTQTIRVIATQLMFTGEPSPSATSGVALTTQPIVSATDENGNLDVDITTNVTLSNSGGLAMSNNSMNFVAGVADFGTPNNFMFTTGGAYVMLSASDGSLNSISPSTEIAVDIVGCTIFDEDFESHSNTTDLPSIGATYTWDFLEITNSVNDWGIGTSGDKALTIYRGTNAFEYRGNNDAEQIAYCTTPIDASSFKNLSIEFNWLSDGDPGNDYGTLVWTTGDPTVAANWSLVEPTEYSGQTTFISATKDISVCDGQQFYIGFRWINDGSGANGTSFAVDDIVIKGFPKFDYNFSYRQDTYEAITGTVVTLDGQAGANISLPAGFDFSYDGSAVSSIRANENGWLEMGTSQTGSPLASNDLTDVANTPLLAPFWDDLTTDAQTKIIYLVEGTAPARTFTIEWRDALWGTKRENFQVKLYETSYVIEFWYGNMSTNGGGSASIGINNSGGCMNKLISVIPGTIPTVSYTAENNSINSTTYLNSGLVYIFNPLQMQAYLSWQSATTVVGQANFTASSTTVDQSTTPGAKASAVSSKGVLAIGSGSANRVQIWSSVPNSNGAAADFVIGQPNFTSSTSNTTQDGLYFVNCVAFSPDGNKLLVAEGNNHRIMVYDLVNGLPTGNGQNASVVIGQNDFISNSSGCSATKFNSITGLLVTPDGKLLVTDPGNNRILIFNSIPTSNGAAADVVIGQTDFLSSSSGSTASKLDVPWDCAYTPEGKLLVSDNGGNNRVLIFNDVPTTNGASADLVIGNDHFGPKAASCTKNTLNQPSVTVSVEGKIAIADFNHRVLIYDRVPSVNNAPADYVLGQPNFTTNVPFNDGYNNTGSPSDKNIQSPYSICFDLNGRLFVNGDNMHRVMVFGETPTETADLELNIVANETNVCIYSDVEYTVQVTNNGGDAANSVVVNAQLPVGFTATGYDASVGTYNQKSGYWTIPYVAVGETVTLAFEGEVQPGLAGTNVTAYANIIASKQKDSDFSNNGSSEVVAVRTYYAPTSTDIADQYINRNSHTIPAISFTVDDQDSGDLAGVTYSNTSSNTTLIPVNYATNLVYAGTVPNKTLDITPALNEYGYSDMELILTDTHGCHKNYDFRVAVGNIWEGNGNPFIIGRETKWDETRNWSSGNVPSNTIEAIIPTTPVGGYFPIIDISGAECLDMIIEPKASVTVNGHNDLTIHGDLTIQSDALGTGSLVDLNNNGDVTISGNITVERYIINDAWHYVSTPLDGVTNKVLTENVCGANYNGNVLDYNEAYSGTDWLAGWEAPWATVHNNDPLLTTNGYAYYSVAGQCSNLIEFTGSSVSLNTGNYTYSVTNQDETFKPTGTNPHRGWNLVGNPYPSGLNADDFMSANSGVIDGTVYFWDELGDSGFDNEGADYAAYNTSGGGITGSGSGSVIPDQYISCGQAFYVHRTHTDVAGSNISFSNSMREAENSFFFKKEKQNPEVPKVKLNVINSHNMYNEIVVMLLDDAMDNTMNPKYDGFKPEGNADLSFYSIKNENALLFQGIHTVQENEIKSVPLGIHAGIAGKYIFSANLIEYIPDSVGVYLEDKVLDEIIDLRKQANYSVTINETGRFNDRFVLHFNINHAPYLVAEIYDKTINCEEFTSFNIPANTFADADDDNVEYSASLVSGANLPNWINFNPSTYTFSGTPTNNDAGVYRIRVKGTDTYGAEVYDDFNLTALSTVGVAGIEASQVSVYPNPTSGKLYISSNVQTGFTYQITDVTGKIIIETNSNSLKEEVDISNLTSGIYFVKVVMGDKTSDFKIFLQK